MFILIGMLIIIILLSYICFKQYDNMWNYYLDYHKIKKSMLKNRLPIQTTYHTYDNEYDPEDHIYFHGKKLRNFDFFNY
jgi:hypothetical protein